MTDDPGYAAEDVQKRTLTMLFEYLLAQTNECNGNRAEQMADVIYGTKAEATLKDILGRIFSER